MFLIRYMPRVERVKKGKENTQEADSLEKDRGQKDEPKYTGGESV